LLAQNSRFLILPATGRWPNLASRVLKLVGVRLAEDWRRQLGHPALWAETFVDPQRFRGTCYQAAGWQALGQTQGFARCGQDFYVQAKHPKELWVCPLGPQALEQLRQSFSAWMAHLDPEPVQVVHLDGKVLKNAEAAPAGLTQQPELVAAAASLDTPADQQKPQAEKALTLVHFQTPQQRLIDQMAVPRDANEEAAVAAHLPHLDLTGVTTIGDAAPTVKANGRQITQIQGGDDLFFLKGNQAHAFAKAQQLLPGHFPPSGPVAG
jgi:hypothetical protein